VRTTILADAYQANDRDAELVAEWYGLLPAHVLAAVDFEQSLAA
jgi:hypothetical protein